MKNLTHRISIISLLVWMAAFAQAAERAPLGHWRFEERNGDSVSLKCLEGLPLSSAQGEAKGAVASVDTVPAPFVYDPLAGRSSENRRAIEVRADGHVTIPLAALVEQNRPLKTFTLELFVRPARSMTSVVAALPRASDEFAQAMLLTLPGGGGNYFGASFTPPGGERRRWHTGYYLGVSRIDNRRLDWRHLALVYDAERKSVTAYTGYHEAKSQQCDVPLRWDHTALLVGGTPGGGGFEGLIDEVRLMPAALSPSEFLRARSTPIEGVSFESEATILPKDYGYVDLKEAFGAVGDGKTDDTAAFQHAFDQLASKVPLRYHTLYIPPGEYLISERVRWSRFLIVQGAGRDRSIIRLKDNCPGYADAERPKAAVGMGYTPWGEWGRGAGNAIGNYLFDVTIDTGGGNPGAVGLDHHSNNHGAVENVTIRSGDGQGHIGLSFMRPWPGPSLIKNVHIEGFDYGVKMASQEYSMTLEHVTLTNQNVAGIHLSGNILAMRKITSRNRVPALVADGANTMVTLLDSQLTGGSPEHFAIQSSGGLYLRNVRTDGYRAALEKINVNIEGRGKDHQVDRQTFVLEGPNIEEFAGDQLVCLRGEAKGSLKLPIEETPEVPWGDIHADWINVQQFAHLRSDDGDWTKAIQAAIDSTIESTTKPKAQSGGETIYFPRDRYDVRGTIHLRGNVVRLLGGGKRTLGRPEGFESDEPVMVYDDPRPEKVVCIERLSVAGFRHASPGTLVLKHGVLTPYENAPGCGKLFMENTMSAGWHFNHPQQVWVRQWNPEAHGPGPCITSHGATIWSLGFKTEYESSKLWAFDGAKTEILGAFIYPVRKGIPKDRPIFKNVDSQMAVIYGTSVYVANHDTHIIDIEDGNQMRADNSHLRWIGSRARMDLYTSHPFE